MKTIIRSPAICAILIACVVVMGCSMYKEMSEDANNTKAHIESEFGGEVTIGWNWENGRVTLVSVFFAKPPESEIDLVYLKQRITALVKVNFRRDVEQVEVSM